MMKWESLDLWARSWKEKIQNKELRSESDFPEGLLVVLGSPHTRGLLIGRPQRVGRIPMTLVKAGEVSCSDLVGYVGARDFEPNSAV
jgi:hypothetical protein